MPRQIRMPKPAPEAAIVLGEGEDKRSYNLVARTSRIDDELDALDAERRQAIEELDAGENLSFRQLVDLNLRQLAVFTEPAGDHDESISEYLVNAYENGEVTSSQIFGLVDQVAKTQRPT